MDGVGADMEIWGWEIEMIAGFLRKFLLLMYVLSLVSYYLSCLDANHKGIRVNGMYMILYFLIYEKFSCCLIEAAAFPGF